MRRLPSFLVCCLLAGASASAQCLTPSAGAPAGLAPTTLLYPADDEGRSPPLPLPFGSAGFPMAGAIGPLTHAVVDSNGVVYLTDGSAAVGAQGYGPSGLTSLRGAAGASPRVFPLWTDLEGPSPDWDVSFDVTAPGRCDVTWRDVESYDSGGPRFAFRATLFADGSIALTYGSLPALPFDPTRPAFAGVSIGNGVGTGAESSADLVAGANSAALGLLFQQCDGGAPAFAGRTVTLSPNGSGGYQSIVSCEAASHTSLGTGCYPLQSSWYATFLDNAAARAALDGNALRFAFTGSGYAPQLLPGGAVAFVPPTALATALPASDDGNVPITVATPVPIPGGTTTAWNVSMNGILTASAFANHPFDYQPSGAELAAASELAFYCWHDFDPSEAGSGSVLVEADGAALYVTWNDVESHGGPSPNLATWQFQVDLGSGDVTLVWLATDAATVPGPGGDDTVVGCTLAGIGPDPGPSPLADFGVLLGADAPALALTAAPTAVLAPATVVDYAVAHVPEFAPGTGVHVSAVFLGLVEVTGGIDLGLLGAPGCRAWLGGLDFGLGAQATAAPTALYPLPIDTVVFAPGDRFVVQAVALVLPGSLPNGQNAAGIVVSNGVRTVVQAF
ncbi:MAG: hypothetical protein JNL08_20590 [Planctomycetes bacterium]|nr:hypothetical protein [Planctomycetota bacterium]